MSRLHLVNLPHTDLTSEYAWCAYTQKTLKFAQMMSERGHEAITYAGPTDPVLANVEHVVCTAELPPNGVIPTFSADNPLFQAFNYRAIEEISERIEPRDFICLIGGAAQAPIAHAFPNHQVVEYGIGYGGVLANTHHVYESYAWMHTVLGSQTGGDAHRADGRFFDDVINNYWDADDFPAGDGGDYLLYVGRLIERKGLQIALDVAQATGRTLYVAGAGDFPLPDWVEYYGVVGPEKRAQLMGGALAILTPTLYVEPFGGVQCEARLCGTPAITTDFGAFPELIEQGVDGYRCHTLAEFVQAVEDVGQLDRDLIRIRAIERYSFEAIAPQYERYFERLQTLWGSGFYQLA